MYIIGHVAKYNWIHCSRRSQKKNGNSGFWQRTRGADVVVALQRTFWISFPNYKRRRLRFSWPPFTQTVLKVAEAKGHNLFSECVLLLINFFFPTGNDCLYCILFRFLNRLNADLFVEVILVLCNLEGIDSLVVRIRGGKRVSCSRGWELIQIYLIWSDCL